MKASKQEERRRMVAVHLPETLMSKRIQSLVGRFVDNDGELGFMFRSTRYSQKVMGVELEDPRLSNLLTWLAERNETMLLTGRRDKKNPDLFCVWGLDPGGPGSAMPAIFAKEKQTDLTPDKLNAMLRHFGIETAGPDLTVQDSSAEFQTEEELRLLLRVCGEAYPPEIRAWAERTLDQCEKIWSGTDREKQHAVRSLTYALNISWNVRSLNLPSLEEARQIMDSTFYGLEPVKQRILEVLAQMKRTGTMPSWGLLLDGPAGVGKTSIAKAVARILNLPMAVLDMSTIRDIEDLTGSSRIYSNGRPGRIIQQLYGVKNANAVMVINELDKANANNGKGNPADALLTLLDGTGFTDTFMDVAIPTRGIFFVATCNELGLMDKSHRVAHIGSDHIPVAHEGAEQLLGVQSGLVVKVLKEHVLDDIDMFQPLHQPLLVKQVADLDADLGVLVGVEGGDARLGGAESGARQALLLIGVLEHMIGHQHLSPLVHDDVGSGHAAVGQGFQLVDELGHVQGHTVADDVGGVGVEHTGGELMQCELSVIADDGMACVGAALEADDHIGLLSEQVGDFALALVAPVCAYNCFDHSSASCRGDSRIGLFPRTDDIISRCFSDYKGQNVKNSASRYFLRAYGRNAPVRLDL